MNETERDRILAMVAEGTLRPHEAAHLLAALAEEPATSGKTRSGSAKSADPLMEVQMERPDGSHYTVKVPPSLVPMLWEITKATVRESARSAARDTWDGMKTVVRKGTKQVAGSVLNRIRRPGSIGGPPTTPLLTAGEQQSVVARRQILAMVQDGRISPAEALRLIRQIDAHTLYQKTVSGADARNHE